MDQHARPVSTWFLCQVDGRPHRRSECRLERSRSVDHQREPDSFPYGNRQGNDCQGGQIPGPSESIGKLDPPISIGSLDTDLGLTNAQLRLAGHSCFRPSAEDHPGAGRSIGRGRREGRSRDRCRSDIDPLQLEPSPTNRTTAPNSPCRLHLLSRRLFTLTDVEPLIGIVLKPTS
jgi:hypothetical protein